MTATANDARATLFTALTRSHERLAHRLANLLAAMAANARDDVRDLWRSFDHGLLAHMEAEERFILPAFAHVDHDEALALLREHALLREELFELGIAVDLHYIRHARAEQLGTLLANHATREQKLLYRWADEHRTAEVAERIERHLAAEPPDFG